ncbi:hypothetical protein AB0O57_29330 [Streptomyces sp. NPDC091201]|uniref:hypothetical protein n=1 Tax=Streptomyces sp. NPDC091201 TaxID=3155190 RepID=UPI0034234221
MQMTRQQYLALLTEGKAAHQAGDPSDACPYDRLGNAEQQFGYRYWLRGWQEARLEAEDRADAAVTAGQ